MVLEATVLVIDNSEWMRNGDYVPSRLDAQSDAVSFLFNAKTQSNPENTVGLITMAGKKYLNLTSPSVLVTLTSDIGKILTSLHDVQINGNCKLNTGVQIAQVDISNIVGVETSTKQKSKTTNNRFCSFTNPRR